MSPRVKICGITRREDAELAVRLGAHALGFVLWERSARRIGLREVAAIADGLPAFVSRVGVVVNMPPAEAAEALRAARLDALQLHGDEIVSDYTSVAGRLIKAVVLETDDDVARAIDLPAAITVLVDAVDRDKRGGTGRRADWPRAAQLAQSRPVILAGGLTPENVGDAIECVRPFAVDVSSGVEDAPGIKSRRRMETLFEAIGRIKA